MGYRQSDAASPSIGGHAPRHFAALDLGTNNCRLMIARRSGHGVQVLDRQNRMVCLGEGLVETGELSSRAMDRAIRTLDSYAARMDGLPSLQVRAVATEACRRALNRDSFLSRVRSETGLSLEIISPREEVELAVEGCRTLLHRDPEGGRRAILFDIGGGSTEVAWLRLHPETHEHEVVGLVSLPFGVVTLSEQFGHKRGEQRGEDPASLYEDMVRLVQEPLTAFERVHQIGQEMRRGAVQMLGTSGTVTTLASVAQNLARYSRHAVDGFTLTAEAAYDAIGLVRQAASGQQETPPGLTPDRQHFMLPGCAIFDAIHRVWPSREIIVADRGLRDGMVARMASQSHRSRVHAQGMRQHAPSHDRHANYRGHHAPSSFMGRA
ncbi:MULTISPECIES: Ppx/GppA phosphatase family protein [Asaia]|uniref:Exopolyphosphatase n=1 Tax=Asaia bogorensis TaxID=91915 RepID=A0A060QFR8_9PROT|nr:MULTISPECIES: Ppx/GppA phosphatase family protein [Asaia]ETC98496.1 exopolyphosphatase [Asaia sp. SF2.1]MDL2169882.1 Ppx/GppA phosphatase family protein [Asaia sp. HumB]CDG38106.1 Exopolyphosphatase [Asaia bogorensis]